MKKIALLIFIILFFSGVAGAQAALVSIKIQFLQNGAVLPSQVMTISLPTGATCGQTKLVVPAGGVFVTTTGRIAWDDPANPALDCIATQSLGGVLLALPLGNNYTVTAAFTDDIGATSQASAQSNPFIRGARPLPPVPTGVRVLQ